MGAGGTSPTFLVGAYVIKFFSRRFDGAECFEIERSLHGRVSPRLDVTVPRLVAEGHLFETGWRWPYTVTTRILGTAWREMNSESGDWRQVVARELGAALRDVHELDCPDEPAWRRDVVRSLRATCTARHRRRRMLPEFLVARSTSISRHPRTCTAWCMPTSTPTTSSFAMVTWPASSTGRCALWRPLLAIVISNAHRAVRSNSWPRFSRAAGTARPASQRAASPPPTTRSSRARATPPKPATGRPG